MKPSGTLENSAELFYAPEQNRKGKPKKPRPAHLAPAALALVHDIEAKGLPYLLTYHGNGQAGIKLGRSEVVECEDGNYETWTAVFDADLHVRYCHGKSKDLAVHVEKNRCGWGFFDQVERPKYIEDAADIVADLEEKESERENGLSESDQEELEDAQATVEQGDQGLLDVTTEGPTAPWQPTAAFTADRVLYFEGQVEHYTKLVSNDDAAPVPTLESMPPKDRYWTTKRRKDALDSRLASIEEHKNQLRSYVQYLFRARKDLDEARAREARAREAAEVAEEAVAASAVNR